jgi:membrane carboxypeptidase/penicillin-binding protein PbpC
VPAVKTLAEIGVSNMLDKAELMGIDTWQDRSRFGLSLTLGGGEVKMTDMAELYSTFANQGETTLLNPILEIKNYKGEFLYRNTCALDNKSCSQKFSNY